MLVLLTEKTDEKIRQPSLEHIYRQYHDAVYKRIYPILGNEDDVWDAMQETWLSLIKNIRVLRDKDERCIRAYIMTVARNHAIGILRKKKKELEMLCDSEETQLTDDAPLFDACEACGEDGVLACFRLLDTEQRDVLLMYYYYGFSVKEIAHAFGIPLSTAASRMRHGKKRLITILKERGYHE